MVKLTFKKIYFIRHSPDSKSFGRHLDGTQDKNDRIKLSKLVIVIPLGKV
jgi:hypothetical protein